MVELRYKAIRIMVYEVGLVHRFGRQRTTLYQPTPDKASGAAALSATLSKCLDASADYVECFLAMPAADLQHLPFQDWTHLVLALFVIYKLSTGIADVPEWDSMSAVGRCELEECLKLLRYRLEVNQEQPLCETMFNMLPMILGSVQKACELMREHPEMFPQGIRAHGLDPQEDEKSVEISVPAGLCPGFRFAPFTWSPEVVVPQKDDDRVLEEIRRLEVLARASG
jgi:hypothetical protein